MLYNSDSLAASPQGMTIRGNRIETPRSCGMYLAGAIDVSVSNNFVSGQYDSSDATLPKGAIVVNCGQQVTVSGNVLTNNLFGVSIVTLPPPTESYVIVNDNVITSSTTSAIGVKIDPYDSTGGASVGELEVSNNIIHSTGGSSRSIFVAAGSSQSLTSLRILHNDLLATYDCIEIYSGGSNPPHIDTVDIIGNRIYGCSTFGVYLGSLTASLTRVHDNDFAGGWGNNVFVLDVSNSTNVEVCDNRFRNFASGGAGIVLNTSGAQGILEGNYFQNVTGSRYMPTGSTRLGVDAPGTWATTPDSGDFVQDLNPVQNGSTGSKYVRTGWRYDATAGAWYEQRTLTGN
jgi:hypothetical protein